MSPYAPFRAPSSSSSLRWAVAGALAALLAGSAALRAEGPEDKAAAALKDLSARFDDPKADRERLRLDLLAFGRTCPGTPPALRAAEMVTRLPSPLDRLDPESIPAAERFPGQPKELVAVLGSHRAVGAGAVDQLAFSPDGKLFAGHQPGACIMRVWDTTSQRPQVDLPTNDTASLSRLTFSQDGKTLARVDREAFLERWDLATKTKKVFTLVKDPSAGLREIHYTSDEYWKGMQAAALSADCQTVAVAYDDGKLWLWDASGAEGAKPTVLTGRQQGAWEVAFASDKKTLAVAYRDGTIGLWDLSANPPRERVAVSEFPNLEVGRVMTLAFASDGRMLAAARSNGVVQQWDLSGSDLKERCEFTNEASGIAQEVFSPDCNTLAQTYEDGMVRLWDVSGEGPDEPQILATGKRFGYYPPANTAAFGPDGKTLATGGSSNVVRLWDLTATGYVERTPPQGYGAAVTAIGLTLDLGTLVSGDADGNLRRWDLGGPAPQARMLRQGRKDSVRFVAFAPDRKSVVSFCQKQEYSSGILQRWDLSGPEPKEQTITGLRKNCSCLTLSPDGRTIASAHNGEPVRLWDFDGDELKERAMLKGVINFPALAFSPDGTALACGEGNYIDVFDLTGAEPKERNGPGWAKNKFLPKPFVWIYVSSHHIAYAPDGKGFAWTRYFGGMGKDWYEHVFYKASEKVFNAPPVLKHEAGGASPENDVAFGPDGKAVVSVFGDGHVDLWDPASGKVLRAWDLPFPILCVTFAADGRHLIVGSADGAMYVLRLSEPPKSAP